MKCWRFYVPFGEVNFHGPKDQYFLSHRWHQVEEQRSDVRRPDAPLALVRLEPPVDLNQGSMLQVTAKVTLTPSELREYRRLEGLGDDVKGWLFDRNAAKDAIRLVWNEMTGQRLFPSDIEVEPMADGRFTAHRRGASGESFPPAAIDRAARRRSPSRRPERKSSASRWRSWVHRSRTAKRSRRRTPRSVRLLAAFRGDPAEASLRLQCARRAVARAAGLPEPDDLEAVRVRGIVEGTGTVLVAVVGVAMPEGRSPGAWRRPGTAT